MIRSGAIAIVLGLSALLVFQLTGASVDEQGFLREPFPLLPIGSALLIGGMLALGAGLLRQKFKQKFKQRSAS